MVYFHMLKEKEKHLCMIDDIIFSNKEQIILIEILIEKKSPMKPCDHS